MNKRKTLKIVAYSFGGLLLIISAIMGYGYYYVSKAYNTDNKPYKNYIGYIDIEKAALNDTYLFCNTGQINYTYSGAGLKGYTGSKKRFRDALSSEYNTNNYTDSGYLNFRFYVNCEGNPGWFETIEMNLDLEESPLDEAMVKALFEFTSKTKHWEAITYNDKPINYYMYISYRIENGKVTEIIP